MIENRTIDIDDPDFIEKRNNRKLTADKIRQILSKVLDNPSDSAKRWIWELMQNAKDVPNAFGRVSIKIVIEPEKLTFQHNGDPFSLSNVFSLIQQVSSKDSANTDEEVTGKFGTGFICTHLLSERIDVSGVIFHKGVHRKFTSCLDRSGKTSEEMLPKIDEALEHIRQIENNSLFPIIPNYEQKRTNSSFDTSFIYHLSSEGKRKAARDGIEDLVNTLPATLVNIPKIKSVEIVDTSRDHIVTYTSELVLESAPIKKLEVSVSDSNGEDSTKNFITYTNDDVSIAVQVDSFESPILEKAPKDSPRLFRDFPLIGSNSFHFPFMLNGFRFNPTEDRDGILLHGEESHEAIANRKIIESAFEAAQEFTDWLIANEAQNRHICALSRLPDEKWSEYSEDWIKELQEQQRSFLLSRELVETDKGCIVLEDAIIPSYGQSKESKLAFYDIVKPFAGSDKVPKKSIALNWIKTIGPKDEIESWNHEVDFNLETFLTELSELENIQNLEECLPDDDDPFTWLNSLYKFLEEERETEFMEEYKIVPNHLGEFFTLGELYLEDKDDPINNEFLDILDDLEKNWREELIHRQISIPGQNLQKRDLDDASSEINEELKSRSEDSSYSEEDLLEIAINVIRLEGKQSTGDSFKVKLFKIAKELFELEADLQVINNIKSFHFEVATEIVSDVINKKVEELENLEALSEFLNKDFDGAVIWYNRYLELLQNSETFKKQLEKHNIIPNRYGVFCAMEDVKAFGTDENPLDEKLVDILYQLDSNEDWKKTLLHDGFSLKLDATKFEELGSAIDEALVELMKEESYSPGSIREYQSCILELINWVKNNEDKAEKYLNKTYHASNDLWVKFSMTDQIRELLTDEKSMEFLKEVSESNLSLSDVQELMKIASDLDSLGVNGMESILEHANNLLEEEQNFHYLRKTGENIEEVFKEALLEEGIHIDVKHLSKGSHDFELVSISDPSKRAYVEIKSYQSGSTNPFKFAKSQIHKCISSPQSYFVAMLERPSENIPASVRYLKEHLTYKSNLDGVVKRVLPDIQAFEEIEGNVNDVRLVLPLRERPRIHVEYDLLKQNERSFQSLIDDLKTMLS